MQCTQVLQKKVNLPHASWAEQVGKGQEPILEENIFIMKYVLGPAQILLKLLGWSQPFGHNSLL